MQLSLPRLIDRAQRLGYRAGVRSESQTRALTARRIALDPFAEEFRLLALNVMATFEHTLERSLTIFSPGKGDGRTRIAIELSLALATHTNVLLIDGQLDGSGVHESLLMTGPSVSGTPALIGKSLMPTDHRRLWLLSAGSRNGGINGELAETMNEAVRAGMVVIVDAPAAHVSSDAYLLAQRARNVLYVMRNRPQDMMPHRRAMEHLHRLDARVLGIVLNDR